MAYARAAKNLRCLFRQPWRPDEVPAINGHPFTNSQEYPSSFQVDASKQSKFTALVSVSFRWPDVESDRFGWRWWSKIGNGSLMISDTRTGVRCAVLPWKASPEIGASSQLRLKLHPRLVSHHTRSPL